jgi:putative membrane protein
MKPSGTTLARWALLPAAALTAWGLWAFVPEARFSLILGNVILAFGFFVHASWLLGWRRALAFFLLADGLSFLLEALSLATGLATPYHYTAILGPRFLGVPLVVPLGWFSMLYASHITVNVMVGGSPLSPRRGGSRLLILGALTALVMTAWDLTLDPFMVDKVGAWVWEHPGGFLGIPFANFVSWLEVSFIIALSFRLVERDLPPPPYAGEKRFLAALPVLVFGAVGLSGCFAKLPGGLGLLPPFTMGIASLAALGRVFQRPGGEA